MSYTKKTWANGDTITAEALNNMETGIKNNDTAAAKATTFRVPVTLTEDGEEVTASTTVLFATAAAAAAAERDLVAEIAMPGGGLVVKAPLAAVDDTEAPGVLIFSCGLDVAGTGETPTPTLFKITFTADGIEAAQTALTAAG